MRSPLPLNAWNQAWRNFGEPVRWALRQLAVLKYQSNHATTRPWWEIASRSLLVGWYIVGARE